MGDNTLINENQRRMADLKSSIVGLFSDAAVNLQRILSHEAPKFADIQNKPAEEFGEPGVALANFGQMYKKVLDHRIYQEASALREDFRAAYVLCSSPEELQKHGSKLADAFIARMTGAQMFRIFPDIIEENDPALQEDISGYLTRAEQKLSAFQTPFTESGRARAQTFFNYVKADRNAVHAMSLETIEEILENVQEIYRDPAFA